MCVCVCLCNRLFCSFDKQPVVYTFDIIEFLFQGIKKLWPIRWKILPHSVKTVCRPMTLTLTVKYKTGALFSIVISCMFVVYVQQG